MNMEVGFFMVVVFNCSAAGSLKPRTKASESHYLITSCCVCRLPFFSHLTFKKNPLNDYAVSSNVRYYFMAARMKQYTSMLLSSGCVFLGGLKLHNLEIQIEV